MSTSITLAQIEDITEYINAYRRVHQSPPLTWNSTVQTFAQQWAEYLLPTNTLTHSKTTIYGENLAYFRGYGKDIVTLIKLSVDAWYNEHLLYNYTDATFSNATGHFTTLVWKSSKVFGMGIAINQTTGAAIITYNCSPPSNIIGRFAENVLPPIEPTPVPIPGPGPTPIPGPGPTPIPGPGPTPIPVPVPTQCTKDDIIHSLRQLKRAILLKQNQTTIIVKLNNLIYLINACYY